MILFTVVILELTFFFVEEVPKLDIFLWISMHYIYTRPNMYNYYPVLVFDILCINLEADLYSKNHIGGVTVSLHTSSGVDCGFEPWSGQTKEYKICISGFSANHTALRRKRKTGWLIKGIMWTVGATCLSANCCFSELAL